jgi:D-glycero-D-manno-heptose 1,7-bisphosphate phosphatase
MREIASRYLKDRGTQELPLKDIPIVGDSLRDLLAGTTLGATPHLVLTGKGQKVKKEDLPKGTITHADLMAFAQYFLSQS